MHCDILHKMKCVIKCDYSWHLPKMSHFQNHYVARQKLGITEYLHGIDIHGKEIITEKRVKRSLSGWNCLNNMKMSPQLAQLLQKQCWHTMSLGVDDTQFVQMLTQLHSFSQWWGCILLLSIQLFGVKIPHNVKPIMECEVFLNQVKFTDGQGLRGVTVFGSWHRKVLESLDTTLEGCIHGTQGILG